MTKTLTRTVASILAALALVLAAGPMGAAQAHHSTAHSIGSQVKSPSGR